MARKVATPGSGFSYPEMPKETVKPKCGHCNGTEFTYMLHTFVSTPGFFVYCRGCGAVVSWAASASKK
jgi:hypothetical protein